MAKKNKKKRKPAASPSTNSKPAAGMPIEEMLRRLEPDNRQKLFAALSQTQRRQQFTFSGVSKDVSIQNTRVVNIANEDVSKNINRVLSRFPNLSQDELTKIYSKQFQEYNQELVNRNLAMSEEAIKKQDTIDLRSLGARTKVAHDMPEINISSDMAQTLMPYIKDKSTGFYRTIPCFSKGVIRTNTSRYIYFEVINLDMEKKRYSVMLRDYALLEMSDGSTIWQPGIYGTAEILSNDADEEYEIRAAEEDCVLFYEIYQQISTKSLGWNRIQRTAWKEIAIANAKTMADRLKSQETNNVVQLARLFLRYVSLSNFILESNKPKIAPGQKEKLERNKSLSNKLKSAKQADQSSESGQTPNEIPEKLIRNVGLIKIVSEKTPRVFSSKSIKNYKVPSWTSRGHTRRYKSGKVVYVKPSVHHRKALKNPDGKIPQSVINIVDNRPE